MQDLIAVCVDDPHDAFLARRVEARAVCAVGHRENGTVVSADNAHHAANGRLPHPHRLVLAAGSAEEARRRASDYFFWPKCQAMYDVRVMAERTAQLAGDCIPHLDRAIGAGG